jgi:hypothetical protein
MPTTTINATKQGIITKGVTSSKLNWINDVRNASSGSSVSIITSFVNETTAVYVLYVTSPVTYGEIRRTFLFFDVSSITGSNTITAATLKILGFGQSSNGDVVPVAATAWGGNGSGSISVSDFSNLTFTGTYSAPITSWNTTNYNNFTLNATAISAMNSNGYLNLALINDTYDQGSTTPPVNSSGYRNGITFFGTNSTDLKIELTYSASSGYTHEVNGVGASSIVSVNNIATASIANIIGVS